VRYFIFIIQKENIYYNVIDDLLVILYNFWGTRQLREKKEILKNLLTVNFEGIISYLNI